MPRSEIVSTQDSLAVISGAIEEVKEAFIKQGDPEAKGRCFDGCIGLIYTLAHHGHVDLFDCLFLSHGEKSNVSPFYGGFNDHYLVIVKDLQHRWMATSPANFNIQSSTDSEVLQTINSTELDQLIRKQIGGIWFPSGMVLPKSSRYISPKITSSNNKLNLEVTMAEWDFEDPWFFPAVHQVNLFTNIQ